MGPLVFVVICEAAADFRTATSLAERVIFEQVDWIDEGVAPHLFRWQGRDLESPFWLWREISQRAKAAGVKARGLFDKEPGNIDARAARRALNYLRDRWLDGHPLDAVLLIRDDDGDPDHRLGLEQGRSSVPDLSGRIVIGVAQPKRECWVLAGFTPRDAEESILVAEVRQELSFDPCLESDRLTAKANHAVRSAKRVLGRLTRNSREREEACWAATPLATLRERGEASGLTAFLREVEQRLVPLFTGYPFEEGRGGA